MEQDQTLERNGISFELDGATPHICHKPLQQQKQEQKPSNSSNLSKEIAAIKAQLLALVSKLERIEQKMMEH